MGTKVINKFSQKDLRRRMMFKGLMNMSNIKNKSNRNRLKVLGSGSTHGQGSEWLDPTDPA